MSPCQVLLLGGTEVVGPGGAVPPGGPLVKSMLGVLALEAGRPVGIDRLTDLLWGEEPPDGIRAAIQQVASRLRRGLREAGLDGALRAEGPTYVLDVDPDIVDVLRFRRLMRHAAELGRHGRDVECLREADAALALWRGSALLDLLDQPIGRLAPLIDDERWRAEELRAQSLIDQGSPAAAADRLSSVVSLDPLRERLWVLLAEALLAAGRPDDALHAVAAGTEEITARLGVGPSPALLQLAEKARSIPAISTSPVPDDGAPDPNRRGLLDDALARAVAAQAAAAEQATQRRGFGEAAHRWQRVLDLLGPRPRLADDYHWRTTALLGLGAAHNEGGSERDATAAFDRAAALARDHDDPMTLARAVLGYCAERVRVDPPPRQRELLLEALDALGDRDQQLRARLLTRLAMERYWVAPADEVRELAERAFADADASGDTETRLLAWQARAYSLWTPYSTEALAVVCRAYLADAQRHDDRTHEQLARRWLAHPLDELGQLDAAGEQLQLCIDQADDLGLTNQQWVSRILLAAHHLLTGDLELAEQLANDALVIGAGAEPETSLDYFSIFLWTLRWMQGRLEEVAALVEEVAAAPGVDITRTLALAGTHAIGGRIAQANEILDRLTPDALRQTHLDSSWYIAMASAAEAIGPTGHRGAAQVVLELLEPISGQVARTSPAAMGPIDHQLGICAWALDDRERAEVWFRAAVDQCDRCGMRAFGVRARIELAVRLHSIGRHDEARELAATALPVGEQLGLTGVVRQARALLAG